MKITVSVTADDIDKGLLHTGDRCPIALAARRTLPFVSPWVDSESITEYWDGDTSFYLPDEASAFIARFDNGEPVAPFSFELDVPEGLVTA